MVKKYHNYKLLFPLIIIIFATVIGLGSRKLAVYLPFFISQYTGDTMWALAFFSLFRILIGRAKLTTIFIISLDFSFLIELSQLWHPTWLSNLRSYQLGGLLLGYGFRWTDLLCYFTGCLIGFLLFKVIDNNSPAAGL